MNQSHKGLTVTAELVNKDGIEAGFDEDGCTWCVVFTKRECVNHANIYFGCRFEFPRDAVASQEEAYEHGWKLLEQHGGFEVLARTRKPGEFVYLVPTLN